MSEDPTEPPKGPRPLPKYARSKLVAPAEGGGYVLRVSNISALARRLGGDGWRITPAGPFHVVARERK